MIEDYGPGGGVKGAIFGGHGLVYGGGFNLLKWQLLAALFVIVFSAVMTFILLKLVGLFIPLRMSDENIEIGDTAEHGHEVYPSDVPSLGYAGGIPGLAAPGAATSTA
jgi:ammonia channel protein AmtB